MTLIINNIFNELIVNITNQNQLIINILTGRTVYMRSYNYLVAYAEVTDYCELEVFSAFA